jgi:hypothetical protein
VTPSSPSYKETEGSLTQTSPVRGQYVTRFGQNCQMADSNEDAGGGIGVCSTFTFPRRSDVPTEMFSVGASGERSSESSATRAPTTGGGSMPTHSTRRPNVRARRTARASPPSSGDSSRRVHVALNRLAPHHPDLARARHFDDRSWTELAPTLGTTSEALCQAMVRAKRQLFHELKVNGARALLPRLAPRRERRRTSRRAGLGARGLQPRTRRPADHPPSLSAPSTPGQCRRRDCGRTQYALSARAGRPVFSGSARG